MRAFGVALLIVVLLVGCGADKEPATIRVTLGPGVAEPDREDTNPLVIRAWSMTAPVHASAPGCTTLDWHGSATATINGSADGAFDAFGAVSIFDHHLEVGGSPGVRTVVHIRARCTAGEHAGEVGEATRSYTFPALSCLGGLVSVLALSGAGTYTDDVHSGRPHRLDVGDLLRPDSTTIRLRHGEVTVGAPECDGFRATLSGPSIGAAGYNAYGRGASASARHVVLTGDSHAGGIALWNDGRRSVSVVPASGGTPSTVETLTKRDRSIVRVRAGRVVVLGLGSPLRVAAEHEVHIDCSRTCTPTAVRLVQPSDHLRVAPAPPPRALASMLPQTRPPDDLLAPDGARTNVHEIRASSGEPAELVVGWQRDHRGRTGDVTRQFGAVIWVRRGAVWRREYDRHFGPIDQQEFEGLDVRLGDATGDDHADAMLVPVSGGSGGCRDFHVVAVVAGRLREIFKRMDSCEAGDLETSNGRLLWTHIVGPCPFANGSAHCYGGAQTDRMQWNGRRFVRVHTTVRCLNARLDPASGCARRR